MACVQASSQSDLDTRLAFCFGLVTALETGDAQAIGPKPDDHLAKLADLLRTWPQEATEPFIPLAIRIIASLTPVQAATLLTPLLDSGTERQRELLRPIVLTAQALDQGAEVVLAREPVEVHRAVKQVLEAAGMDPDELNPT